MTKEDAKDYIREWCPYDKQDEIIKVLEQEPCEDCISRQAAIDAIWDGINMDIYTREVKECLEHLPSVITEKTGHCKVELLQTIRNDAYQLGFMDGKEHEKAEQSKYVERLQKDILCAQKRAAWLQDKLVRTKENYDGQINNLQNKIKYYEGLCHIANKYTDMKGE